MLYSIGYAEVFITLIEHLGILFQLNVHKYILFTSDKVSTALYLGEVLYRSLFFIFIPLILVGSVFYELAFKVH